MGSFSFLPACYLSLYTALELKLYYLMPSFGLMYGRKGKRKHNLCSDQVFPFSLLICFMHDLYALICCLHLRSGFWYLSSIYFPFVVCIFSFFDTYMCPEWFFHRHKKVLRNFQRCFKEEKKCSLNSSLKCWVDQFPKDPFVCRENSRCILRVTKRHRDRFTCRKHLPTAQDYELLLILWKARRH